ncbi:protein of unknown function (plasmid) [Cupriavidus taiwanensis]|uniref:Uncharacterized protein n=1 Tax=Cupriavidus taiwanensis TaxID=164546 RepID=A0A375IUZ3_9BURK|nr:protein of unknown function [Cupriavidus taiwanensis]
MATRRWLHGALGFRVRSSIGYLPARVERSSTQFSQKLAAFATLLPGNYMSQNGKLPLQSNVTHP